MKRSMHAVAWVLLVVVAVVLWPQRWGGSMTYVITRGTSMQPAFVAGDLALLRADDDYRAGDVVAYRSDEIGQIVMHRVQAEKDGVFTFKGDNNDFVDPDRVREQQMLGRLVLRVPKVGLALAWLLKPVNLALAVGALLLLLSDRRPKDAAPAVEPQRPLLRMTVSDLQLPASAACAVVVDEADLLALAQRYDRPVLELEGTGELVVNDGAMVYRHRVPVAAAPEVGSGRDWVYGMDAEVIALLPRPRRADADVDYGVDLRKLLRLG